MPLYFFDFLIEEWLAKDKIHPIEGKYIVDYIKKHGTPSLYDFSKIMKMAQKEISNVERVKQYPKSMKMLYKKYDKN